MNLQGFRGAPVTRSVVFTLIISSILVSIVDIKYLFHIQIVPHLWVWRQFWRVGIWQLCYANSGELLFASALLYNLRVVERLFGSRKYASFLTYTLLTTSILPPLLLALIFRPLTTLLPIPPSIMKPMNYLPPGPTSLIFAILAQYHAAVPHCYKIAFSSPTSSTSLPASSAEGTSSQSASTSTPPDILATFSDKLPIYLLATQLAFTQSPGSLLAASVGWIWGYAWRAELLPGSRWRVPGWLFDRSGGEYEALRRRLAAGEFAREGEGDGDAGVTATATGVEGTAQGGAARPLRTQLLDQFRGAF